MSNRKVTRIDLQRMAMRDLTDVHLHPELPDITETLPKPQEQVIIHRISNLSKQEYDLLQQTALRAINVEKRLNEYMKPKKKPETKYGYRGIR